MTNTVEQENQASLHNEPDTWTQYAPVSSLHNDEHEPQEPPSIRTQLPLPARPIIKGGFAVALCVSVLGLIWIFFQLAGGLSWNESKPPEDQDKQVASKPSSTMTPEEKLQWCLATRNCGNTQDPFKKQPTKAGSEAAFQKKKDELVKGATSTSSHQSPSVVASPATPSSVAAQTPPAPPAAPTSAISPTRSISPFSPEQPIQPPASFHPAVSFHPPTPTAAQSRINRNTQAMQSEPVRQKQDPMLLLAQAANFGVYTTAKNSNRSYRSQVAGANSRQFQSGRIIPVTTRIKAEVTTGISWVGNSAQQRFRIQTSEDVKADDGTIIPKGTLMLAQVSQANSSGYVEVQILSINVQGQEEPIPADTIIVKAASGQPLHANVRNKGRGLGSSFVAAGLAGISEAATAINSSQIIVGNNTTTVNGGSNVWAGMAKGVAGSLSQQVSNRISQTGRSRTSDEPVMILREGTKLELFINQPLSI